MYTETLARSDARIKRIIAIVGLSIVGLSVLRPMIFSQRVDQLYPHNTVMQT